MEAVTLRARAHQRHSSRPVMALAGLLIGLAGLIHLYVTEPRRQATVDLKAARLQAEAQMALERARHRDSDLRHAQIHVVGQSMTQFRQHFADLPSMPSDGFAMIYGVAQSLGLVFREATYAEPKVSASGLIEHRIAFPIQGSFGQIERLIDEMLVRVPNMAIDRLTLERQQGTEREVSARFEATIFIAGAR